MIEIALANIVSKKLILPLVCFVLGVILKCFCNWALKIFKANHFRELKRFCDLYRLNALTDNLSILELTPIEERQKTRYICAKRVECIDKLNDLCIRNHKIAYDLLESLNPLSSKARVELNFDGFMQAEQFVQTDSLEILERLKKKIDGEFSSVKLS